MARNPAIDPPRLAPPAKAYSTTSSSPTQSRSPSPSRHSRNHSQSDDPLGRDLSPTRTLKAFTSTPGSEESKSQVALVRLIEKASTSERAFGIRIAQTCKDIKAWHAELQQWPWSGSFEPPAHAAHAVEGPYWGSLRETQVVAYEQRIQDIREALFDLDVDELKDYVLSQHVQPKTSDYELYERLDDFTALITATILRALPDLSRLGRLLDTWSMRVTLLRKVPGYLRGLDQAKTDLDNAWSAMAEHLRDTNDTSAMRDAFHSTQEQLESRMGKVGGRLDSMLDDLEGRDETLPDVWIDTFESLEANYSDWRTRIERHIAGQNVPLLVPASEIQPPADVAVRDVSPLSINSSDHEQPAGVHAAPDILPAEAVSAGSTDHDDEHSHVQLVESPILGAGSTFLPDLDESSDVESDNVSQDLKKVPVSPIDTAQPAVSATDSLHRAGSLKSLSPSVMRSRHVPIVVNYNEAAPPSPSSSIAPTPVMGSPTMAPTTSPAPALEQASPAVNSVRARAAFLNGGIERTQSLQKSVNSPVRPFEHASMAFTKLFNKTNNASNGTPTHSRTSSTSSRASNRKGLGLGLGLKNHEGFRHFHRSSSLTMPVQSDNNTTKESHVPVESSSPPAARSSIGSAQATATRAVSQPAHMSFPEDLERPMEAFVTPEIEQDYFPSTENSKSTLDSDWSSPAHSEFPENWPLPVRIYDDEIHTPKDPMGSDVFERMFVDSLPGTPQSKSRPPSQESNPFENMFRRKRSPSKEPLFDDAMLGDISEHRPRSGPSSPVGSRPRHMSRPSTTSLPFEPITELPTPGSFDATPELQDASSAGYFRAKQVQTSPGTRVSPNPRTNTSWSNFSSIGAGHDEVLEESDERDGHSSSGKRLSMIKRASVTSIEAHSRSELTTIEIPVVSRRSSLSSPPTAKLVKEPSTDDLHDDQEDFGGEPPAFGLPPPTIRSDTERSNIAKSVGASKPPPLNLEVHKRRYVVEPEATPRASETNRSISQPETARKGHTRNASNAEQLDRHVSRVLNTLPSRIAFKPSLSLPSRESSPAPGTVAGPARPRPLVSSKPLRTGLTLSAAQSELTTRRSNANDADGKMYYLTQEGREQPIKLFVRLVGEGERCMVRVGGGWADLGEYLRQYAEHHGHRTFSDGKLEVGSKRVGGGTKTRTPLSRPGSVLDRPDSSMSFRSRSSFGAAGATTPMDMLHSSPSATTQPIDLTPTAARNNGAYHTPTGSVKSFKSSSRPSTADTFLNASPSSWSGQEIGLAGPAAKHSRGNRELDEQKARWVEEMMTRAKEASSIEKKKSEPDRAAWADMGKVGGTRRMMFRHKTGGENGSG
ncbi:hypothetical protein E4T49_06789 [Aureobasidium sp. EXF-10728]|nr:hypothetical protein E4T49_06789 [Aureobasidium sp. EXF-10728]